MELSKINNYNIKSELYEKGQVATKLIQRDSLNTDAIASLSATTGNSITTTNSE